MVSESNIANLLPAASQAIFFLQNTSLVWLNNWIKIPLYLRKRDPFEGKSLATTQSFLIDVNSLSHIPITT